MYYLYSIILIACNAIIPGINIILTRDSQVTCTTIIQE